MAYKKNFNKNYNRNRNRNNYNGGQYKNNKKNDFDYMDRPQETKPTFEGFDATQYIKSNINIKDMNGKIYIVKGNFPTSFTEELVRVSKQITEIQKNADKEFIYIESLKILKNWCLLLLNQNIDGETYTLEDVERGFNDVNILKKLMIYIGQYLEKYSNEN